MAVRRDMNFGLAALMMAPRRPRPQYCPVCHKHQMLTETVSKRSKATMIFAGLLATDLQNFGCGLQTGYAFRICGSCCTAIKNAHKNAVLPERGSKSPSLMRSGMKLSVPMHLEEDGAVPLLHAHGDPLVRAMHLYTNSHSCLFAHDRYRPSQSWQSRTIQGAVIRNWNQRLQNPSGRLVNSSVFQRIGSRE